MYLHMSVRPENFGDEMQQQLNAEGVEDILEKAREARRALINYAVRVVIWRARQDEATEAVVEKRQLAGGEDEEYGLYTVPDALHGFIKDDILPETVTLKWVPGDVYEQEGDKELVVYVPVDKQGKLPNIDPEDSESKNIGLLPPEIFLAITHSDDSVSRYVVSEEAIIEYESAGKKGEQDVYDDLHPREWQQQVRRRVDDSLPLADTIKVALVNMNTIPQRTISTNPEVEPTAY